MKLTLLFLLFIYTAAAQKNTEPITMIAPISELGSEELQISTNNFCEYPDITIDQDGNIWIAYTELSNGMENIILKKITGMEIRDSLTVNSSSDGNEYYPRLYCDKENKVWIVWSAKRNSNWDIFLRSYSEGKLSDEINITSSAATDIHPAITGDNNNIWITWESLENNNFEIYATSIFSGKINKPINISSSEKMDLRPVIISVNQKIYITWDQQHKAYYQTLLREFNGEHWEDQVELSTAKGFNLAPNLSSSKEGIITAAWHSNLQPDGTVGFNPWIYIKTLNDQKEPDIFTPAESGDWIKTGEDQAFEFPTLLYDQNNLLWVFGRASQSFYVQAINEESKSPLYKFPIDGWGGRGQHIRSLSSDDGFIYSVRRDINFIYLNRFIPLKEKINFSSGVHKVNFSENNFNDSLSSNLKHLLYDLQQLGNYQILFGDIHQHSSLSDGRGTADECYTRSKYIYKHDFAALTDHEWFTGNLLLPSEWEWIKIIGQYFDEPDKFITFAAYEWTTPRVPKGFGHKNVYFSGWDKQIFSFKFDAVTTPDLFNLLKENNAIAFPHHIGWTGVDWENHDEEAQPDVEIVSSHGAFEHMGNEPIKHRGGMSGHFVQDGLSKGLKFGLIGSSDGHGLRWHHGIGRKEDEWQTGLTGAIVAEKTKFDVMEALKKRRVYATSGTPIRIIFKVNDKWMGEEVHTSLPPEIYIEVIGTAEIDYVILIKDNKEILHLGRDWYDGYGVIKTYVDEAITEGEHFYYLRIIQKDGEMSWSSPVWVHYNSD